MGIVMTFRARIALCLLFGLRGELAVHAQAPLPPPVPPLAQGGALPVPVTPPALGQTLPPPVVPSALPSLPAVPPVTSAVRDASSIQKSALTVPLLIRQLLDGKLTPEKAWESGVLTQEDLFYIFEKYIDDWGGLQGKRDAELRRALMGLLVQHGAEQLKNLAAVPARVRLWIGDYYQANQNPRAVDILESILAEIKAPVKGENPLVFQTLERLAWYYRGKGEFERGAQTWLRMPNYQADVGWWTPDALLEAARLYSAMGNEGEARELYAKIPRYGHGWLTGLSLLDQASHLFERGEFEQGRELLERPVTGDRADAAKTRMLSRLGYYYYRQGDFEKARHYSQEAIHIYDATR
ncbi:MAG: hypothetical protein M3347_08535, partial [Armatimonadota bacterium]|nr:hypothetical protein [Armatimonadota bacterium]